MIRSLPGHRIRKLGVDSDMKWPEFILFACFYFGNEKLASITDEIT